MICPIRLSKLQLVPFASLLVLAACEPPPSGSKPAVTAPATIETAEYIGSDACADCHQRQWSAWQGSQHDLALQPASPETVLATFSGEHDGVSFDRHDGHFLLNPGDTPDGTAVEVRYTFGVDPLQQYLVPAGNGRLQSFPAAWDTRSAAEGGQRWFRLYEHFPAGDPMHWRGRANRWNSQCADCHSTAVRKNYQPATRSYATSYALEDVSCEACHGPGSLHAANPGDHALFLAADQHAEINSCAPCHSRRSQLAEGMTPKAAFLDHYSPRLLDPGLYYPDGQILDEVYVYGSFLQSRMHRAGVTCSNCHDPHSATLKLTGNLTCTQCHRPEGRPEFATLKAGDYDSTDHHFHPPDSTGAACVSCHMPATTYMKVDARRDHSFRLPRPDLSEALDVPNACTGCHADQSPAWAAQIIRDHFGPGRPPHFAPTFAAAASLAPDAEAELASLAGDDSQPIMVRASALARLGGYRRGYTLDAVRAARLGQPLLRLAAPLATSGLTPQSQWRLIAPLLEDELRAVRHQAFISLLPLAARSPDYQRRLEPHLSWWLEDQSLNLDTPEAQTSVASALAAFGRADEAEAALLEALQLQPSWVPALVNLADLYRRTGRDVTAGAYLERALDIAPEQPDVAYGYALWQARQGNLSKALSWFETAARLAPDQPRFGYAWAVALNDTGSGGRAIEEIERLLARWPDNEELLIAAVTMLRDQQKYDRALQWLEVLMALRPQDRQLQTLQQQLRTARAR